jgi:ABC-type transport system involved in multi-copper enzyme maturation permease subunit
MLTWFRLAWRLQRSELRLLLGACLLVLVGGLLVAWQMRVVRADQLACFQSATSLADAALAACRASDQSRASLESASQIIHGIVAVSPFVLGLFLGVPIVAREIEGGTGSLAWSVGLSRRSWLIGRAGPVLAFLVVGAGMLAIAGEVLTHAMPWAEGAEIGFADYAMRGPLVVVRAVEAFAIALLLGALVARQLPAMLVAGVVTFAVLVGIQINMDATMAREAVPLDAQAMQQGAYPKIYGSALRDDATGELIAYEEYFELHPAAAANTDLPEGITPVQFGIPGFRYGEFALRESAMLGIAGVVASGLAFVVVHRRRPY